MKKNSKGNYYYSGYFREHFFKLLGIFLLTGLATAGSLYGTEQFSLFIAKLQSATLENSWSYALRLLITSCFSGVCVFLAEILWIKVRFSVLKQLQWHLAKKISESSIESVTKTDSVELFQKVQSSEKFIDSIYAIISSFWNILAGILATIYCIYNSSWHILILFVGFFTCLLTIQSICNKYIYPAEQKYYKSNDNNATFFVNIIDGFTEAKSQGLLSELKMYFSQNINSKNFYGSKFWKIKNIQSLISTCFHGAYEFAFSAVGIFMITHNIISFNSFVKIFMYQRKVTGLSNSITALTHSFSSIKNAIERMNEIMQYTTSLTKETWGNTNIANPIGNISIENLSVKIGGTTLLDNISVDEIPRGSFVGLVGPSGSGKSTFLKTIGHAQEISSGTIFFDKHNSRNLTERSYQRYVTYAPQTTFIFPYLTIKQNLLLANPQATDAQIWKALEMVSAREFVEEKGLDYSEPHNLSGGQKQRLALARLILCCRRTPIILLDESTSALDNKSQADVMHTIEQAVRSGHTIFFAAHSIQTLKNADIILFFKDGQIIAKGTYSELLKNSPEFKSLVTLE